MPESMETVLDSKVFGHKNTQVVRNLMCFVWAWMIASPLSAAAPRALGPGTDEPKAIQLCREILAIRERIAAISPDDKEAQRDCAVAHESLSLALLKFGEVTEALRSAETSLRIKQSLLDKEPGDVTRRFDLCVALESLGNALLQAARYHEALEAHEKRLAISRQLLS